MVGICGLSLGASAQIVQSQYNCPYPENFLEMSSIPAYNNTSGTVILLYEGSIIDRFDYTETMHYSMLKTTEGVSLERINHNRPTQDASNWHSAAATVGFATPAISAVEASAGNIPAIDSGQLEGEYTKKKHDFIVSEYNRFQELLENEHEYVEKFENDKIDAKEYKVISDDIKSAKNRQKTVE